MKVSASYTEYFQFLKSVKKTDSSVRKALKSKESARNILEAAKSNRYKRKSNYLSRKKRLENLQAAVINYERACETYSEAGQAYDSQFSDFKQFVIALAGVPKIHRNNVELAIRQNGVIDIFFGCKGYPVGDGHGHYVIDRKARVEKWREQGVLHTPKKKKGKLLPFTRSSQNTIDPNVDFVDLEWNMEDPEWDMVGLDCGMIDSGWKEALSCAI
jgi:hypothetical protein